MRVTFLGPIKGPPAAVAEQVARDFPGGEVCDLLLRLGFPAEQHAFLSVLRGQEVLGLHDRVGPEDELTVMLLVGGG
jgi:hypothetical protein